MEMLKTKTREDYEEILTSILRNLPLERVSEVIDFARFIETQIEDELEETETTEEIAASEAKWDALVAHPQVQAKMIELAEEALIQADAGLAMDMEFDAEGNLVIPQPQQTN